MMYASKCNIYEITTEKRQLSPHVVPDEYQFHQQLNDDYGLYWKFEDDEIIEIGVRVKAEGWVISRFHID